MRPSRLLLLTALAGSALLVTGCGTLAQLGGAKTTPDEFRVVTKPPLVIPPEYALRPPAPGEPRPQELAPESAARNALLGARQNVVRSQGENLLVAKAGIDRSDPLIRYVVDDEFGDIAHKEKSFADRVMFWRKDAPTPAAAAGSEAAPVDAAAEQARIASLTGGRPVVIQRQRATRFKLPGL
jgi:hypothetical protein